MEPTMNETEAFMLGFLDHVKESDMGRTWDDNQDLNEAYDRGWNFAQALYADGYKVIIGGSCIDSCTNS